MPKNDKGQMNNIGTSKPNPGSHINVGQPRPSYQQPQGPMIPTGPGGSGKMGGNAGAPIGGNSGRGGSSK